MTMMKRWVCPNDEHDGVLAPSKMRRDDARRYCLPCTAKTGRLVERVCPSLEKQRDEKQQRKRDRAAKAAAVRKLERIQDRTVRAARRAQAKLIDGVELDAFIVPMWRAARSTPHARDDAPLAAPTVEWSDRRGHGRLGVAYGHGRVVVYTRRSRSLAGGLATLLHELAHVADVQPVVARRRVVHGPRFQAIMADAARKLLPGWEPPPRALWKSWRIVDDAIEIEIGRRIAANLPPIEVPS